MRRDDDKIARAGTPLQIAIFVTVADDEEDPTYPAETTDPCVYKGAYYSNPTFPLTQGAQTLSGSVGSRTEYLLGSGQYYPLGSKLLAEKINNRWWIRGLIDEA